MNIVSQMETHLFPCFSSTFSFAASSSSRSLTSILSRAIRCNVPAQLPPHFASSSLSVIVRNSRGILRISVSCRIRNELSVAERFPLNVRVLSATFDARELQSEDGEGWTWVANLETHPRGQSCREWIVSQTQSTTIALCSEVE